MATLKYDKTGRLLFTKEMKNEYKILLPMMAATQFRIMKRILTNMGIIPSFLKLTALKLHR